MFVDAGVLVFTVLLVVPMLVFVLLIFVCDCLVVLFVLTLLLLTFDVLVDLFDLTLLLLTFDCLVICAGFELIDELLLAGCEELIVFGAVVLLCPWLLLFEELLSLATAFLLSLAKL